MRPNITIALQNGNLGLTGPSENGISVLIVAAPVAPTSGYGVAKLIRTKAEASLEYVQSGNADVLEAINEGFFAEAAEGTKLYCVAFAQATTLTDMADEANAGIGLEAAGGTARLLALMKFPSPGYTPTITNGMDADVHTAATALQALSETWLAKKKPFRFIIPAFAYTNATDAKDYSAQALRNGSIVIGKIGTNHGQALTTVLGRLAKISPQRNAGRVKEGSLNIPTTENVTIAGVAPDFVDESALDTLHTKRYITFEKNQIAAGYILNDDNTLVATADDYNNLRNGRVIDNAVRVAYASYYEELKDDVEVDENGFLDKVVEKALETKIQTAIDKQMRGQLNTRKDGSSDVACLVNPDTEEYAALYAKNNISSPNLNIIQSETIYLFIFLKPKGCIKYINVYLGLTATS